MRHPTQLDGDMEIAPLLSIGMVLLAIVIGLAELLLCIFEGPAK